MRTHKRTAIRSRTLALETLERRACPAAVSIAAPIAISEAGTVKTITVSLDAPSAAPVSVGYFVQGTATLGPDYDLTQGGRRIGSSTGTLTFAPGQTRQTIALSTINDTLREGNETLSITLIRPRGCTLGVNKTSSTILRDDDNYTAALVGAASISAGGDGRYTLQLSAPATKNETFYVSTVAGSATAGSDFVPLQNMPLAFRAGERSKEFRVQIRANTPGENDEGFIVTAVPASTGFPIVPQFGTTILGSGATPSLPGISVSDVTMMEGNAGVTNAQFRVSLSSASSTVVSVTYATGDGTATASDNDYTPTSGVVSFTPGETQKTVVVQVTGDTRVESDESFSLFLSKPSGAALQRSQGIAVIRNDDTAPVDQVGFQIQIDYVGNVRQTIRDACNWAAQRWSQVIVGDLPGVPDLQFGYTDDFRILVQEGLLGGAQNGQGDTLANARPLQYRSDLAGLPWLGETGIDPFDATDPQLRNIVLHELGHALGFGGMWLQKNLVRDATPGSYTSDPTYIGANAVREYNRIFGLTGTSLPVENLTASVPGSPFDGSYGVHWRNSVFQTELMTSTSESAGVAMPLSSITVGAMQDLGYQVNYSAADVYSPPSLSPTWSVSDMNVAEGNSGLRSVLVTIGLALPGNLPASGSISVTISLKPGTAIAGSDYLNTSPSPIIVTWSGGAPVLPVVWTGLFILGDSEIEPDETLFLVLTNPTGGSSIGRSTATVTILNDDGPAPGVSSSLVAPGSSSNDSRTAFASLQSSVPVQAANGSALMPAPAFDGLYDAQTAAWRDYAIRMPVRQATQMLADDKTTLPAPPRRLSVFGFFGL